MATKLLRFDHMLTTLSPQKAELMSPAFVEVDADGILLGWQNQQPKNHNEFVSHVGLLIPAFTNAHSHAFQYSLAGHSEFRSKEAKADNFWTWRELMYQASERMNPEIMLSIARALYSELALNGYQHVHEFHYLHHDIGGKAYAPSTAMAEALFEAAKEAHIDLTILPVFYKNGGFNQAPNQQQKRFISSDGDAYLKLWEDTHNAANKFSPNIRVGAAFHSIRAVTPEDIKFVHSQLKNKACEFHIHISEQIKEVEDCQRIHGTSPIELLADSIPLDQTWNLVHATHATKKELALIAKAKSRIVICPSTEANLGDGIFPLGDALDLNINLAIGSDSHVATDPFLELQLIEYLNRALHRARNIAARAAGDYTALSLLEKAWQTWQKGDYLNGILVDLANPRLNGKSVEEVLSSLIFSSLVPCHDKNLRRTIYHAKILIDESNVNQNNKDN